MLHSIVTEDEEQADEEVLCGQICKRKEFKIKKIVLQNQQS